MHANKNLLDMFILRINTQKKRVKGEIRGKLL